MEQKIDIKTSGTGYWLSGGRAILIGMLLLGAAACATTGVDGGDRYARAYDACDERAGVCYARCEDFSVEQGRRECQSDCSFEADQCFADVSRRAERDAAYSFNRYTFYGRYGAWYPGNGYRYGPHGRRFSYAPWRDPYFRTGYGSGYNSYDRYRDRNRNRDRDRDRNRDRYVDRDKDDDGRDDRTGDYVPYDYVEGPDRVTPRGRGFTSTAPRSTGKPDTRLPKVQRGPAKPKARPAPKGTSKPALPPKGSKPAVPNRPAPKPSSRPKPVKQTAPKPASRPKPAAKPTPPKKAPPKARPGRPQKKLD